jgi:esterase/lipase superfamily enzyme
MRFVDLTVTVPKTKELGRFEPSPQRIGVTLGSAEWKASQERERATEAEFKKTLAEMLARTRVKEVYISVHGVNNQHTDSISRIAQIWHFFGREGVPIAYSWPAGSPGLKQYMYDRESSEFTVYHLKEALQLIASCPEVERVNIIGHSRGTDVVSSALRELHIEYVAAGKVPEAELKLGTVVLAAPDLDIEVALQRNATVQVGRDAERFALYVGGEDKLLRLSKWIFGGMGRFGDANTASMFTAEELQALRDAKSPEVIDAQISDPGSFGHDYFVSNPAVSSDLILLMRYHRLPGAEYGRPLGIDDKSDFWVIKDGYPKVPVAGATTAPAATGSGK